MLHLNFFSALFDDSKLDQTILQLLLFRLVKICWQTLHFMQRPPIVGILTRHDFMPEHVLGLYPDIKHHKWHWERHLNEKCNSFFLIGMLHSLAACRWSKFLLHTLSLVVLYRILLKEKMLLKHANAA